MKDAAFYIDHLSLAPHPEGGYYKETYRSAGNIPSFALPQFKGSRSFSTAIYYLLQQGDFSAFHRIKSDECWHYYAGDTLLIHILDSHGGYSCIKLGAAIDKEEVLQFVVPAGAWFAARCAGESSFVLTGCTVAPGFDFADFEMADRQELLSKYQPHHEIITALCR